MTANRPNEATPLARYRVRRKNRPGEAVIRLPGLKSARGRG